MPHAGKTALAARCVGDLQVADRSRPTHITPVISTNADEEVDWGDDLKIFDWNQVTGGWPDGMPSCKAQVSLPSVLLLVLNVVDCSP